MIISFAWKFPCHLRNGLLLVKKKKDKWRWRAYIPGLLLSLLSIHMILLLAQLCVLYEKGEKTRGSTILWCNLCGASALSQLTRPCSLVSPFCRAHIYIWNFFFLGTHISRTWHSKTFGKGAPSILFSSWRKYEVLYWVVCRVVFVSKISRVTKHMVSKGA